MNATSSGVRLRSFLVVLPTIDRRGEEAAGQDGKIGGQHADRRAADADGRLPRRAGARAVFADLQPSLASVIERLDDAAADKDVAAVWLKIEDLAIGRAKLHELRGAVARLRKADKPVYAELTTADTGQYLLAAACDKIVMPPSGMLIVPGVRAEITFYKGLLDKLGLQVRRPANGQVQRRRRTDDPQRNEQAAAGEL